MVHVQYKLGLPDSKLHILLQMRPALQRLPYCDTGAHHHCILLETRVFERKKINSRVMFVRRTPGLA